MVYGCLIEGWGVSNVCSPSFLLKHRERQPNNDHHPHHVFFHAFLGQPLTCGNSCIPKGFILFGQYFCAISRTQEILIRREKRNVIPILHIVMGFTKYIIQNKTVIKAKVRTQGKYYVKVKTSIQ